LYWSVIGLRLYRSIGFIGCISLNSSSPLFFVLIVLPIVQFLLGLGLFGKSRVEINYHLISVSWTDSCRVVMVPTCRASVLVLAFSLDIPLLTKPLNVEECANRLSGLWVLEITPTTPIDI
jgi:hypothetical protein